MYDQALKTLIASAFTRLRSELEAAAPHLAGPPLAWMSRLAGSTRPQAYFTHPESFPVLLLPWWLEKTLRPTPDAGFQADLVYSTINGYYCIRLIDNVMDRHPPGDAALLPAAGFFHLHFQRPYQRYFPFHHPFGTLFAAESSRFSDTIAREARLRRVGRRAFLTIAAHKVSPMRIPIAAVCFRNGRRDLIRPWWALCDTLGRFAQMMDDVFDWHVDLADRGATTYFLCEAAGRKRWNESIEAWILRDGFHWGVAAVRRRLAEVRARSRALGSSELERYLARREGELLAEQEALREGLRDLAALEPLMGAPPAPRRTTNGRRAKRC